LELAAQRSVLHLLAEKPHYPLIRRLGGPHRPTGRFGEEVNLSACRQSNPDITDMSFTDFTTTNGFTKPVTRPYYRNKYFLVFDLKEYVVFNF
jgi:hypothetical protein